MRNKILVTLFALILLLGGYDLANAQGAIQTPAKPITKVQNVDYISVKPLEVVAAPQKYLNQNIKMQATFDKFSTLGLDYKPALKKSEDYIGFLIRRDDVTDHVIPLSEMKIFLKRKDAEKFIDLESGDIIEIQGKVFSAAMGDPWVETNKLTVIKKIVKDKDKK